jgi:CheY-like chemotaxis protein
VQADDARPQLAAAVAAAGCDLRQSLQTIRRLQAQLSGASNDAAYAPQVESLENALRTMDQALRDINRLEANIAAKMNPTPPSMPEPPAAGAVKVLHIEDDPSVARALARLLRLHGYEVAIAATREEAMHLLEVQGLRPDLILTDSQLRLGLTGDRLVTEIATRLQFKPPTIMLSSGIPFQPGRANSIADRILRKPIDICVLLREIEDLLGRRP